MPKRVVSLVLFCVMIITAFVGVVSVKAITVGDINSDGNVNIYDCALLKRAALGFTDLS